MLPLRYRIGADDAPAEEGCTVEAPYGVAPPPGGIWYCNLYDQTGTGDYGPYLPDTGTSGEYGEKVVDPNGAGWTKLLTNELSFVSSGDTVEWDNLDGYPISAVMDAYDRTEAAGIKIVAKNPGLLRNPAAFLVLSHPAVTGCIVESGAGTPAIMDRLRKDAGKPDLPVWFVFFGTGRQEAEYCAAEARNYQNMGVTYDSAGEYGGDIVDVLKPTGPSTMAVTPADVLARAESYKGKYTDPDAPALAREVGQHWPEMADYAAQAGPYTPWCGIFVAKVVSEFGFKPPFGLTDTLRWMWVDAWKTFGTVVPVGQQQPGDIIGFVYPGILHHVTFYAGNGKYCGGNQSDAVTETSFSRTPSFVRRIPSAAQPSQPASTGDWFTNITATVFGGPGDEQPTAYSDVADGWPDRPGVALPYRFVGTRPKVRVRAGSRVIDNVPIVDVGPWNDNDPYWTGSGRPQAESGTDLTGRHTNLAGIDLTPATAQAIGVPGKGLVDWQFITTAQVPTTEPSVNFEALSARIDAIAAQLKALADEVHSKQEGSPMPETPAQPQPDIGAIVKKAVADALAVQQSSTWSKLKAALPSGSVYMTIAAFVGLWIAQGLGVVGTGTVGDPTTTTTGSILTSLLTGGGLAGVFASVKQLFKPKT